MRNRFENYINNGYQSQFVPTPLDTNMMFNVLKERQGYYDNLVATNANLTPQFNYIKPNDFDMGHQREAMEIQNLYAERSSEINEYLKNDNLEGAKNLMLKTIHDKDLKRKVQYLEASYNQDLANLKSIEGIKKMDDRNLATHYYYKNRLQGKSFQDYYEGKTSPLNSPILGENPDLDNKINQIGAAIAANGYTFADGSRLESVKDANGNSIGKYRYVKGDVTSEIREDEAFNIISTNVLNDPEVQSYIGARQAWGSPIIFQDEQGNTQGPLMEMFRAQAAARSHRKSNQNVSYMTDDLGLAKAKGEVLDPNGVIARPPARNAFIKTQSSSNDWKIEGNKFYTKDRTVQTSESGKRAAALSGGIGLDLPMNEWVEYKPTDKEIQSVKENFVKIINQDGTAQVVNKNSSLATNPREGSKIVQLDNQDAVKTMAGYEQSMQSVSWATTTPFTDKKLNSTQLAARGDHSVQVKKTGADGNITYETKKMSELPDLEFYNAGYTLTHPEYTPGREVWMARDESGNEYEAISNKQVKNNRALDIIFEANQFLLENNIGKENTKAIELAPNSGQYIVVSKDVVFNQNSKGFLETSNAPTGNVYMIQASSPEEAVKNVENYPIEPTPFGTFTEQMTRGVLSNKD